MTQALLRTRQYEASAPPRLILGRTGSTTSGELSPSWRGVSHEKAFAMAPAMALFVSSGRGGAGAGRRRDLRRDHDGNARRQRLEPSDRAGTELAAVASPRRPRRYQLLPRGNMHVGRACHPLRQRESRPHSSRVGIAAAASLVTFVWVDVPGWIPATIAVGVGWSTGVALVGAAAVVGARVSSSCPRRRVLHIRSARVRASAPATSSRLRIPRDLPSARARRSRVPLHGARVLRSPAREVAPCEATAAGLATSSVLPLDDLRKISVAKRIVTFARNLGDLMRLRPRQSYEGAPVPVDRVPRISS